MARNRSGAPASVKITDVAAAAGVAPMTVSRVLNTPERVSGDTRARVQAVIERMGYVPNLIAGGLSSRRSRMIAAIVPTIASPMFSAPIQAFTDTLGAAGYRVMLALSGYGDGAEDELIRAVLSRRPDGLLLTGANHTPPVRRLLANASIPVVEIWDASTQPTDMLVGFDHEEVGAAVADYFAGLGHIRFAAMMASDPRAAARSAGFARRVGELGFPLIASAVGRAPSGIGDGRRGIRELAPKLTGRTAVFCSSDLVAFGVLMEARLLGLSVPRDLALCGFGDMELSREADPPFTTVSVDGAAMGRIAAEHILARLRGEAPAARRLVPFRIIPRTSS